MYGHRNPLIFSSSSEKRILKCVMYALDSKSVILLPKLQEVIFFFLDYAWLFS